MSETVHKDELRTLVGEWRERADEKMEDIDPTASHYTGNAGSLCMGVKVAAGELEDLIEDE